ncbi:DUF3108 domain-containing protein [Thiothrix nivea]|uniref:DUF3108 domain-containing protein n=1 Tax=Thiothrix nivea (strain ATCC 35100 / DSM 5205 / JP2) TaxID=870187 RepID=A0A656HF37_THINJ|nr:DUF3108 domain-containing protein [Thiothrix nivea]EIJ35538.1 hypothetical protein Thini_3012 [Thiothrix nivea DSM 5205]
MKYPLLALGLLLLANGAEAAPQAFQANYTVTAKGMNVGTMAANLSYTGNTYTYQKLTKANGLAALLSGDTLTERSTGSKNGENLIPTHYLNHHKNKRKDKKDELDFTSPTHVSGTFAGDAYTMDVPKGTLDAATLELYLMDALAANQPLAYKVVSHGKLQDYRFRKLGKETIKVPAGSYECETVEVVHKSGERQTTLWLAPELNYAIVQVSHTEDGDLIETRLSSYQPR